MHKANVLLSLILSVVTIFSPLSFERILTHSQAYSYTEIKGYQEWTEDKTIDGFINVNRGATLVVKKGITITFNRGDINIDGTMVIGGTVMHPVVLKNTTGTHYSLSVSSGGRLVMRNTDVSGSGFGAYSVKRNNFVNKALAAYINGGINVSGGWLNVEGCNFHDNNSPIVIDGINLERIKINRSKFLNNNDFDIYYFGSQGNKIDARYNWWGSPDGPSKYCYAPNNCYYNKFKSDIDISNWLTSENYHDPVIIIPGIMGSFDLFGKKVLDPILGTYNNLYKTFKENGYTPDRDLFIFPYEWRDSNIENAKLLRDEITKIKQIAHWPKVDVVAHSMGGLLAREYIESDYYQDDIDQLITLGTPQKGAPEDYLTWENGDFNKTKEGLVLKFLFTQEAKENGYSNIYDYVQNRPISSVRELLPNYDYLYDLGDNILRSYPQNYPVNSFLDNLNALTKVSKLNNIEFDNIIGNLNDDSSTISKINIVESDAGTSWPDGYPEGFDSLFGNHGLIDGNGDGTVPIESANALPSDEKIEIDAAHRDIPAKGEDITYKLLTKNDPEHKIDFRKIASILTFFVFSPIDIQVVETKTGKRVGKDFDHPGQILNEIEGAYYSGYDTNNEFLTIPNPEDGEYKIITQGIGNGEYKIEATKISEDPNNPQNAIESTGTISGISQTGINEEEIITVDGNNVLTKPKDTTPPTINISSPENIDYLNNQIINFDYAVTDDESGVASWSATLDGKEMAEKVLDLSVVPLGNHEFKITAEDKAGNESEKLVSFNVATDINAILQNINHYKDLNFITDQKTADFLQVKIKDIAHTIDMIGKLGDKNNVNPKANQIKLLNKQIDDLIAFIQGKLTDSIIPTVKELLIESLASLKIL